MTQLAAAGQRVLVTAGAAGIGRAIVEALAAAGACVHLCDVDEASRLGHHLAVGGDC